MKLPICQGNDCRSIYNNRQTQTSSPTVCCINSPSECKQNTFDVDKDDTDDIDDISHGVEEKTIEGRKTVSLSSSNRSVDNCDDMCKWIPSMFISLFFVIFSLVSDSTSF